MINTNLTNGGTSQSSRPVRFYKFVALTFLVLTLVLLGVIVFMSSKRAEITIITRSDSVNTNFSVSIGNNAPDDVVSGFVSSTFVEFESIFSPDGSRQEEGNSEGFVTIINESNSVQPLVATTRLLTPEGILFRLKKSVQVPAGGSIEAAVYADQPGDQGDIDPSTFTIPGLNKDKQSLIYAKSDTAMHGGIRTIGVIDESDIEEAELIMLDELKKKGAEDLGALHSEYTGLYKVAQYTFEDDGEIGIETDAFTITGKATIVGVFYDAEELLNYAKSMLGKQVVDNSEVLQSLESEPTVVLGEYDLTEGVADIAVTYAGLVNLDSNSRELQKIMFFGKTEDEVRRYVMSLDHVQGVEMKFKPLWNRSVPHVASHVGITVRQVE